MVEIHQAQIENRPSIDPVTIVLTKGTSTETHTEEIEIYSPILSVKVLKIWTDWDR